MLDADTLLQKNYKSLVVSQIKKMLSLKRPSFYSFCEEEEIYFSS
jgi:hypothetical protein